MEKVFLYLRQVISMSIAEIDFVLHPTALLLLVPQGIKLLKFHNSQFVVVPEALLCMHVYRFVCTMNDVYVCRICVSS